MTNRTTPRAALQAMVDCGRAREAKMLRTVSYNLKTERPNFKDEHWEASDEEDNFRTVPCLIIRLDADERKRKETL